MIGRDERAVVPSDFTQDLASWGRSLGLRNLFRPQRTGYQRLQALRLSLIPIDFWRYAEFTYVHERLPADATSILDIASPRILSAYIAHQCDATVTVCDLHPKHSEELELYKQESSRLLGASASADGLPFGDAVFPYVYSVSVIEHIGGDGDIRAMSEIARVLKPGGLAAITVPIANRYDEVWHTQDTFGAQMHDDDRGVFFCRIYDRSAIEDRLLADPTLEPINRVSVFADDAGWLARYQRRTASPRSPIAIATKLFDGFWARRHLRLRALDDAWPEGRGVAMLLLRKRA